MSEVDGVTQRVKEYSERIGESLSAHLQDPNAVSATDIVALYAVVAKLGTFAQRIQEILLELRDERRPLDAAERGAFLRYFDLVDELNRILGRLDIAMLDIFRPGLAKRFAGFKSGDMDIYQWFEDVASEYAIDQRTMPESLKRLLEDWTPGLKQPLVLVSSVHLNASGREEPQPIDPEALQRLEVFCRQMKSLADEIGLLIRENLSLSNILDAERRPLHVQVGDYYANVGAGAVVVNRSSLANSLNELPNDPKQLGERWALETVAEDAARTGDEAAIALFNELTAELTSASPQSDRLHSIWRQLAEVVDIAGASYLNQQIEKLFDSANARRKEGRGDMGDVFENIGPGTTIISRSTLVNSMNSTRERYGQGVVEALEQLAKLVEQSENTAAADNFNGLTEELGKPQPRKGILLSLWNGIVEALPALSQMADITTKLAPIFS